MLFIQSSKFLMGSNAHYPEEGPAQEVCVDSFWIDETPVTNKQFQEFVSATGYVTLAERLPDPAHYPGIIPSMIQPGSLVFRKPDQPVSLQDPSVWWEYLFGSNWKAPRGPESSIRASLDHPVVHVAYEDCEAFAKWAGKALPTEAEWECAARGGLHGTEYAWGNELRPQGMPRANIWEGQFPWECRNPGGVFGTTAVRTYPPNEFGLYDMIGNVWEWTCDWYEPRQQLQKPSACCTPRNPRGGREQLSYDPCMPEIRIGRKVLKGGSHLCATNYCCRYRPAARYAQPIDTSASHVGFRCVVRSQVPAAAKHQ